MKIKKIIIWIVLGLVAILTIYFFVFKKPKISYQTEEVKYSDVRKTVSASGSLVSESDIELDFEIKGRITGVNIKKGQKVAKGEALAYYR